MVYTIPLLGEPFGYRASRTSGLFTASFYDPRSGTYNIVNIAAPGDSRLYGEALPARLYLAEERALAVKAFDTNGTLLWTKSTASNIARSVAVDANDKVFYGSGNIIYVVDGATGAAVTSFDMGVAVNAIQVCGSYLVVVFNTDATDNVKVYTYDLVAPSLTEVYSNPQTATYSRGALVMGDLLVVADSSSHRVYGVDMTDDSLVFNKTKIIWPDDVFQLDADHVLICEEHANRLTKYNVQTGEYSLVYAAPIALFNNIANGFDEIVAGQAAEARVKDYLDGLALSSAAEMEAGVDTLYSANGAIERGGKYLVADTDNHRVIVIRDGLVVSALRVLNNPVKIALAPAA